MTCIITGVNLSAIDLNLFVVLDAVLAERSATRAAARLHVTQSAVSNALARLRRVFGDPLLVRTRRGLAPTPRALALAPQLSAALAALETVARDSPSFDLRTTPRAFTMAFAELYGPILLPSLLARVRAEAPYASLQVVSLEHMVATDALAHGEVDLYVGIPGAKRAPDWRAERLFDDEPVAIVRKGHPAARRRLTPGAFAALPHVQGRVMANRGGDIDDALARHGLARRVVLDIPHFATVFAVVASTDCIATVSRRQADYYAASLPLRILPHPLPLPVREVALHWHLRADRDAGVTALRAMVRDVLRSPAAPPSRRRRTGTRRARR